MAGDKLNWADIWVLKSIYVCIRDGDFDLSGVIAVADGINHAILTSEESNNAVYRLKTHALIEQDGSRLLLTKKAVTLFEKHEKKGVRRRGNTMEKELNVEGYSSGYDPNILDIPEEFVSKEKFKDAVKQYLDRNNF
jgi:hypothetical protein